MNAPTPFESAYEIAKLHAAVDGAFDETLTRHWFEAAWELCAEAVGFITPSRQITESVTVHGNGRVQLSHRPSSEVRLYASGRLVAVLSPNAPELTGHRNLPNPYEYEEGDICAPALCCLSGCLQAVYSVGQDDACGVSPAFVQAVAQLFAYMAENRGDVKMDDQILTKSGAKGFLNPWLTYAA